MTIGVCVLLEGKYEVGAAALINSLYRWGFRGSVYVGVKGPVPNWIDEDRPREPAPGLKLVIVQVGLEEPLVWCKPRFLLDVWANAAREHEVLYYFDADIVLVGPWRIFETWAAEGLAVCADVNPEMPAGHPFRLSWRRIFDPDRVRPERPLETYFNAGFVGLPYSLRSFLETWSEFNDVARRVEEEFASRYPPGGRHPLSAGDQDALNAALQLSDVPLAAMGRDGMGFQRGGGNFVMAHPVGAGKPWNVNLVGQALLRRRPSLASRAFVENLSGPLEVYGAPRRWMRRADLVLARGIGALIGS